MQQSFLISQSEQLQKYHKVGIQFVIHRNTGKEPANKTPGSLKRQVQSLIKEKYFDLNYVANIYLAISNANTDFFWRFF